MVRAGVCGAGVVYAWGGFFVIVKFKKLPSGLWWAIEGKDWADAQGAGSTFEHEIEDTKRIRTTQQRKALEVFCADLAAIMEAHGIGMKAVMKAKRLDVPVTQSLVKDSVFRPVFTALTGLESTADADTSDFDKVHRVLCKNLPEAFKDYPGFIVPEWPSRFGAE